MVPIHTKHWLTAYSRDTIWGTGHMTPFDQLEVTTNGAFEIYKYSGILYLL